MRWLHTSYITPEKALGIPEDPGSVGAGDSVSLGNYGTLILQFTDNALTTSSDPGLDLWVFEVGNGSENVDISISTNGTSWIDVGTVSAGTTGIDIDAFSGSGVVLGELYQFVRLVDVGNDFFTGPYAGADINAVGTISSQVVPEPSTAILVGLGLVGLTIRRRRSNSRAS